jgi:hypothetical protein
MLLAKGRNNDKNQVRILQEGLAAFGYAPGAADGVFGQKTEDALEAWQQAMDLYPDGVFGKGSLAVWNTACQQKNRPEFLFPAAPAAADPPKKGDLGWNSVPADPLKGGYSNLVLRADTAQAYKTVLAEVHRLGGLLTTAGGKRGLSSQAGPARSTKSFHYTGRALDLALPTGMQNLSTDAYIVVREGDSRKFTVWAKVLNEKAPGAATVPEVSLTACTVTSKKNAEGQTRTQLVYTPWKGKAFNLTALFANNGFVPISGRKDFFAGGSYSGAEWWHFQWVQGLVEGETTFGAELLRVYSLEECKAFIYWEEAKDAVYGVSWF